MVTRLTRNEKIIGSIPILGIVSTFGMSYYSPFLPAKTLLGGYPYDKLAVGANLHSNELEAVISSIKQSS